MNDGGHYGSIVIDFSACFDSESGVDIRRRSNFASQELVEDWALYKDEEPDVWFKLHEMEEWLRVEDIWLAVSGPVRGRSALLAQVIKLFSWQSGIPSHIVSFLGLTKGIGAMDSWLMFDMTDSARCHRISTLMYRAMVMQNFPHPHFPTCYERFYEKTRPFCKRCGEQEEFDILYRGGVCGVCRERGRRFCEEDDIGVLHLDVDTLTLSRVAAKFNKF